MQRSEFSTFPVTVEPQIAAEPLFGNRFAYFEFPNPQGAMIVRHTLDVRVSELRWDLDPLKVQSVAEWPESFAPYLRNESQAVVSDARSTSCWPRSSRSVRTRCSICRRS